MPAPCSVQPHAGKFGPETYAAWRATSLGDITEALERRLVLRLAGDLQGRSVLDVGCGDGTLALACWESGTAQVAGLDLDTRMITRAAAFAAQHQVTIGYTVGRADTLPFGDKSFDLVVSVATLTFVPEADRVVREMARVLRPGGRLVIGDLGKWSIWAARRRVRAWLGSPTWRAARFRTAGELLAMARQAGLSVGRVQGAIFFPPCTALARVIAPIDARLGQLTTLGAAFVAIQATKSR
jgi:2-polyprenyl-3-methyl-5-hydroxy-6-metoxy-1,4-benzoquinol methylase